MAKKRNFLIAGGLMVIAMVYLIISSTSTSASYYMTIQELYDMPNDDDGRRVTVSGAVIGSSISYDTSIPRVTFTMVQIPGDLEEIEEEGGLAEVLHKAVTDSTKPTLDVVYDNVKPDLLQDEAQAIVRGHMDGSVFVADELLLKCPSRYAEDIPEQAMEEE